MVNIVRLLITARDPGPALAIVPIIESALATPNLVTKIVAQGPAIDIFLRSGFDVREVKLPPLTSAVDSKRDLLFHEVDALLRQTRPDAVLTGLSGPGLGVDEAVQFRASTPHRYTVQDLEGWVVYGFGTPAPTYFVTDESAAIQTQRHADVNVVTVGSLKHAHYQRVDPVSLRRSARAGFVRFSSPAFGFYGQPAWGWKGYESSIRTFAKALGSVLPNALVIYRPHPRETAAERGSTYDILARFNGDVRYDASETFEKSLATMDVVVTCFSTCAIDHVYLHRESAEPLGTSLFLLFEPDLRETWYADTGQPVPRVVADSFAYCVTDRRDLERALLHCADPQVARGLWQHIRRNLQRPAAAPERVITRILGDLTSASEKYSGG